MTAKTILGLTCALCAQAALSPEALCQEPDFDRTVIFATNSVAIGDRATIAGGDIVVNDFSDGAQLGADAELQIGSETQIDGTIRADSIAIGPGAGVGGAVECNEGTGISCSGLSLPVFDDSQLPVFTPAAVSWDAVDADIPARATLILEEGSYADIRIGLGATLVFTGGTYDVGSIIASGTHTDCAFPCRSLVFEAPTELRISGTFDSGDEAFVGSADGSQATASNVVLYVGGSNLEADPSSQPAAANLGAGSLVEANVWVPNGTLLIGEDTIAIGAFFGLDVAVGNDADVALASAFDPRPTANEQKVFTSGTVPLSIELSASDPEGDSLTFEIVRPPSAGRLSELTQDPPSRATVTYTASQLGDLPDDFVFRALDPAGGSGEAVTAINPATKPAPDAPSDTVLGHAVSLTIALGVESVEITLSAFADVADPESVDLTFSIEAAVPTGGVLSGLSPASPSSATVLYTPDVGFEGSDRFVFEVCGDLDDDGSLLGAGECDTADVVVTVGVFGPAPPSAPAPTALDFTADLQGNAAVEIDLAHQTAAAVLSEPGLLTVAAPALTGSDTITVDEGDWTFFNNCDLGVPCPAPAPFTFATTGGACVSVTDAFLKGDQFEAFDNGTLLGKTSPPFADDGISESDPNLAFVDPNWSSGTFTVGAGSHSIDIQLTGSLAAPPTAAYLRVDSVGSAFCSGGKADLVVTSLTRDVSAPIIGTSVTFTAVVENVGVEPAGASSLCFQVGTESCDGASFEVPSLEPGATFEVMRTATVSIAGSFQNTAVADLDREVDEESDRNNTAVDTYTVTDPELIATIHVLPELGSLLDSAGEAILSAGVTLDDARVTYVPGADSATSDSFEYSLTDPGTGLSSDRARVTLTSDGSVDPCALFNGPGCDP